MFVLTAVRCICALCTAIVAAQSSLHLLHMLQLESYQMPGYRRYLRTHKADFFEKPFRSGLAASALQLALQALSSAVPAVPSWIAPLGGLVVLAVNLVFIEKDRRNTKAKKALVFTGRMKRLIVTCAAVYALAALVLSFTSVPVYVVMLLLPLGTIAGALCIQPYENHVNMGFFRDAQRILANRPELIKIGITGSYGKTSTKHILATILSEKYNVYATPGSTNTPMGITAKIRGELQPFHQVFIAEMGARHKGDVDELVELVHPQYGLLTSVGPQHLETFGNIETVANTKFELIDAVEQANGTAFFAADGAIVDSLYARAKCKKVLTGLGTAEGGCYAKEITCDSNGSSFTLVLPGREVALTTCLLGTHNIQNICLACACAAELGLTDAQIISGVAKLTQTECRLQLVPNTNGISVINDAFNANPVGAKEALRVLSTFPGKHIVVTPGFVEEGNQEEELNRIFGSQIAKYCDWAILVGKKHVQSIEEGALAAGMPRDRVVCVPSLNDATALTAKIATVGDAILYENDLPDNYNE